MKASKFSDAQKAFIIKQGEEGIGPNEVWAMDFVHDQLAKGKKLRVLTVVAPFSRYVPVLDARFSYRGEDVVATLDRVCCRTGYPKTIRVDQGSEFISRDMDIWVYQRGVTLDFSHPGKPKDNAFIQAFNGRFRAECGACRRTRSARPRNFSRTRRLKSTQSARYKSAPSE